MININRNKNRHLLTQRWKELAVIFGHCFELFSRGSEKAFIYLFWRRFSSATKISATPPGVTDNISLNDGSSTLLTQQK